MVVRTSGSTSAVVAALRGAVRAADPDLPVIDVVPLTELVGQSIAQPRFYMLLLSVFALVALLLAALGVFGVFSYLIALRTREIGIRMALGAGRRDVIAMVTGRAMQLVGLGVGLGLAAALTLDRMLRSLLFGVTPTDPLTLIGVTLLLSTVAYVACYLPARRAARLDPVDALRAE